MNGAIMILRTTLILSALAIGVSGASAKGASAKGASAKSVSAKVETAKAPHFTHSGGRHSESHRHFQRWDHPHTGLARHSGSNHSQGYVRNSGPRFHGPHRDW
jgi:hypothetical protein